MKKALHHVIFISLLFSACVARAEERELILSSWEADHWALFSGAKIDNDIGKSESGEALSRITLASENGDQAALTQINLPATATTVKMFVRKTDPGSAKVVALFQDAHGWGGGGNTLGAPKKDETYSTPAMSDKTPGWTWRVGFFKTKVDAPFRFRGFTFQNASQEKPATIEAGPVRVAYTPDDANWFYADLQPKTLSSFDGVLPPVVLRVANLGTQARTFELSAQPIQRNLLPCDEKSVGLGSITLAPGELKTIAVKLPLNLLGRYAIEYSVNIAGVATTQREMISVVNAFDVADGFRHWTAQRKWFSEPDRRPRAAPKPEQNVERAGQSAWNGLSQVPIFPVMARVPRETLSIYDQHVDVARPLSVVTSQLSPAWLCQSATPQISLFGGMKSVGQGAPSHVAFPTLNSTRVVKSGETLDAPQFKDMAECWMLAWFQGSTGWDIFDVPYLIVLQHRPTSMSLDDKGLRLSFADDAGCFLTMPLYGYAKFPQKSAFEKQPEIFKLPQGWTAADLQTWKWNDAIPAPIRTRCSWWSQALVRFPYDVKQSFQIDHAKGAVEVHDAFSYLEIKTDWNTPGVQLAPLSPTLALARRGGFPLTVIGETIDLNLPTMYGPYTARVGASELHYSLNIGPWLQQAACPNLTRPADESTPARRAQLDLLRGARANSSDREYQMWDWKDENFVWYAQANDFRIPALLTAYTNGALRQDRKFWLQARALFTVFDRARYKMDERGGTLTRRYIDGPGIGNWGSPDWGDSGKLATDMIYDAYVYTYNTGDYQTIVDNWDLIASLNTSTSTMSWLGVGRSAIAELGDEAPPMLALARLAYAVGDREIYGAAVNAFARELVHHHIKEGAFTQWREQFSPWNEARVMLPTETPTNTWGSNAGWMGGGFHSPEKGENQWDNFYVRFDDIDTLRFHQQYAKEMPKRVMAAASIEERKNNAKLYFARIGILGDDAVKAQDEFLDASKKDARKMPDSHMARVITSFSEFPPKLETLIPADAPPSVDKGFAWDQMNNFDPALVSPSGMARGKLPTPQWFHWKAPQPLNDKNIGWGDKWTFGAIAPGADLAPAEPPVQKTLNAVSSFFSFSVKPAGK